MDDQFLFNGSTTVPDDTGKDPQDDGGSVETAILGLAAAHTALEAAEEQVRTAQTKSERDLSGWLRAAASEALTQNQRARDRAVADVEKAAEELAQAREAAAPGQEATGATGAKTDTGAGEAVALVYDSAEEFLHEHLLPLYNRPLDARNGKWCSQWFLHAEAVSRVDALWRAWEHLRLDASTGLSVWWKDHADVHMTVLLSQKGPFYACSSTRHNAPEPFPCEMAPEGWLPRASETPDP